MPVLLDTLIKELISLYGVCHLYLCVCTMTDLPGLTSVVSFTRQGAAWLLLPWVAYIAVKAVYNLYFHPLVKYPGPSLAAASDWWQVYIEVFAARSLSEELWNLHQQYGAYQRDIASGNSPSSCVRFTGDIVRIAPNTVCTSVRSHATN